MFLIIPCTFVEVSKLDADNSDTDEDMVADVLDDETEDIPSRSKQLYSKLFNNFILLVYFVPFCWTYSALGRLVSGSNTTSK